MSRGGRLIRVWRAAAASGPEPTKLRYYHGTCERATGREAGRLFQWHDDRVRVAYFADWELAELEHHGIDLVNAMLRRVRASGLPVLNTETIPEGPHFVYEPTKDLFFGRLGRGPLVVVWDTNLLIDYFDHGRSLWAGESLPDILPSDQGGQL